MKLRGFYEKDYETQLSMCVLFFGALVGMGSWAFYLITTPAGHKFDIPWGLFGMPISATSSLISLYLIYHNIGVKRNILLTALTIVSLYYQGLVMTLTWTPHEELSLFFDVLMGLPLLYVYSHYCVRSIATKINILNYLGFIFGAVVAHNFGAPQSKLTLDVVAAALTSHPVFILSLHFITKLRNHRKDLLEEAKILIHKVNTDELTKLTSRAALEAFFAKDKANLALGKAERFGVLLLDIDHFKRVNDTLGHDAGDAVLMKVSHKIAACIRPGDIAARWGGEEFVIIVMHAGMDGTLAIAERILEVVRDVEPGAPLPNITVSIGVAIRTKAGESQSWLLKRADECVYHAKHAGRNQIQTVPETKPEDLED